MAARRCPVCGKSFDPEGSPALPFCSDRCHGLDLGRWLDEKYGMPYEPEEDEEKPDDRRGNGSEED